MAFLYLVGNEETLQNIPEKKASAAVFKHYRAQFLNVSIFNRPAWVLFSKVPLTNGPGRKVFLVAFNIEVSIVLLDS